MTTCPRCTTILTGPTCACGWRPVSPKPIKEPDRVVVEPAPNDYLPRRLVMQWIRGQGSLREAIAREVPKFLATTPPSNPDRARAEALLRRMTTGAHR